MPEKSSRMRGKFYIITSAIKQKSAYISTMAKDMENRKMARIFFRFIRFIRIFSFFIIPKVWENKDAEAAENDSFCSGPVISSNGNFAIADL